MLELWEPEGAFGHVEAYLREAGFFGGGAAGVVADVYLGYGLGRSLRRTGSPDPPEPCYLPLAACRIRPLDELTVERGPFSVGDWTSPWSEDDYATAIESVRVAIAVA